MPYHSMFAKSAFCHMIYLNFLEIEIVDISLVCKSRKHLLIWFWADLKALDKCKFIWKCTQLLQNQIYRVNGTISYMISKSCIAWENYMMVWITHFFLWKTLVLCEKHCFYVKNPDKWKGHCTENSNIGVSVNK